MKRERAPLRTPPGVSWNAILRPRARDHPPQGAGSRLVAPPRICHPRTSAARADRRRARVQGHGGVPCRPGRAEDHGRPLSRHRAGRAEGRRRHRSLPYQRVPARRPARDPARPVVGPRRGDRRQRAGRVVQRARVVRGLFPSAAGHEPPRRGQLHQPRRRQGRRRGRDLHAQGRRGGKARQGTGEGQDGKRAQAVHCRSQREGEEGQGRSADWSRTRGRPDHPDPVSPVEEQPALRRRSRRRQDRYRRGAGAQDRRGRGARRAARGRDLFARHGRAARRHPLSRRLRGAAEGGGQRAGEAAARGAVHRRDPHGDRCRRDQRRRDGRVQPAQAGAFGRQHPLHRLDHLQGVPQPLREGPRPAAPVPEDRRQRADDRGHDQDPGRPAHCVRGASLGQVHPRRDQVGGGAVGALHQRPQAARQGDRRDRRGRRDADAGGAEQAQEDDHPQGDRGR